jgi:hypothetical protein
MPKFTALYDACVLYPAPLRDLLMRLAVADLVEARWTSAIHDEWTRNVLKQRPDLKPEQLQRTRELMNVAVRDCLAEDYEHLIPTLSLETVWELNFPPLAGGIKGGVEPRSGS